jgi:hyperosmotically inducible periplasmic protein
VSRSHFLETTFACFLACSPGVFAFQDQPPKPDNTRTNRDGGVNADDQAMNKADRHLAQQVRKAVTDDKSLSTYAHNIKIISQNGMVTLRGPVRSEDEKAAIEAKAREIAGVSAVNNELTIAPKKQ